MRRFRIPALLTYGVTTLSAHGDDFSWQVTGGAQHSDVAANTDTDTATLTATYHFRPVDDTAGPYALAAFLNRASRLSADYTEDKATAVVPVATIPLSPPPPEPTFTSVSRATGRALSGRHVWRNTGWYAGASLAERAAAQPTSPATTLTFVGDDLRSRSLELGKYLGPSTAIELSLETAKTSVTSELAYYCVASFRCAYSSIGQYTTTIETELDNIGVSALHVGRLGRMRYSLSGGVTSSKSELTFDTIQTALTQPPTVIRPFSPSLQPAGGSAAGLFAAALTTERQEHYSLDGELFPTPALGIRFGYARSDGDAPRNETYALGATWFFKRSIGAGVVLTRAKSVQPFVTIGDIDTAALQFIGRL